MLPMKNNNIIIVEIVEIIVEIIVEKCSNAIYTNVDNAVCYINISAKYFWVGVSGWCLRLLSCEL